MLIEELIFRSQTADIELAEKKWKADKAAAESLRAQQRAIGEMGLTKLLEKHYGSDPLAPDPSLAVPKASPQKDNLNEPAKQGRFPPPPSSLKR